jgi:hypothetical protein
MNNTCHFTSILALTLSILAGTGLVSGCSRPTPPREVTDTEKTNRTAWRVSAYGPDGAQLDDYAWASTNGVSTFRLDSISNQTVVLYFHSPVEQETSSNFNLDSQIYLKGWKQVSYVTLGLHLKEHGYYQFRKSHPPDKQWLDLALRGSDRFRIAVDNPSQQPLPGTRSEADMIRVLVKGIAMPGCAATVSSRPPTIHEDLTASPLMPPIADVLDCGDTQSCLDAIIKASPLPAHVAFNDTNTFDLGVQLLKSSMYQTVVHEAWRLPDDPTWDEDPFNDVHWRFRYHALDWLEQLVEASKHRDLPEALDLGFRLVEDWASDVLGHLPCDQIIWTDHTVAKRLKRLIYFFDAYRQHNQDHEHVAFLLRLIAVHASLCNDDAFYARNQPMRIHNHAFFQDEALLLAALALPELRGASAWEKRALSRMTTHLNLILTDEGVHKENTPGYHVAMLAHVKAINTRLNQFGKTAPFHEIEESMLNYALGVQLPDKRVVNLGDSYGIETLLDAHTNGQYADYPGAASCVFDQSGYAVFRNSNPVDADKTIHTFFSAAFNSITHKHRDDLAFTIYGFGEHWLVDAGLYSYREQDPIQLYARSARSHNTVSIDNMDFPISEERVGTTSITDHKLSETYAYVEGKTEAYSSIDFTRRMLYLKPNIWVIEDELTSRDNITHAFTQHFHFAADKHLSASTELVVATSTSGATMKIFDLNAQESSPPSLHKGETTPVAAGWFFPKYGVKLPNACVHYTRQGGNAHFLKIITIEEENRPTTAAQLLDAVIQNVPKEMLARFHTDLRSI